MALGGEYQVVRFFDFFTDSEAARISVFDDRGDEFWVKVLKEGAGAGWREAKAAAVDAIEAAIERGDAPGEVVVDDSVA